MIKEKKSEKSTPRETAASGLRNIFEEGQKRLEAMTFPCPVDGKTGNYFGMTGTYQIVVPVFQCPDGHKFSVRLGYNNATRLLPNQGFTPRSDEAR